MCYNRPRFWNKLYLYAWLVYINACSSDGGAEIRSSFVPRYSAEQRLNKASNKYIKKANNKSVFIVFIDQRLNNAVLFY